MRSALKKPQRKRLRQLLRFDQKLRRDHRLTDEPIAGLDEAGRGPLAGPVVACAVILHQVPQNVPIDDSKRLTPRAREIAFHEIIRRSSFGVGFSSHEEIDRIGIQKASHEAMLRALACLRGRPTLALIDGLWVPEGCPVRALPIVQGDGRSLVIACASIVAKVFRDRWMRRVHALVPEYDFLRHKGYGTKKHLKVLKAIGPSLFHRFSFRPVYQAGPE